MDRLRKLLDIDIEAQDLDERASNRRIVLGGARTVMETIVKVDENRLRKQRNDNDAAFLDEIRAWEKAQPSPKLVGSE